MKGNCDICGKEIEVRMCCDGKNCGCMGMPIDPPVCSYRCYQYFKRKYLPRHQYTFEKNKYKGSRGLLKDWNTTISLTNPNG